LKRRHELILVTGLLLLAALLRLWDLTRLPPGFSDDELAQIRISESVRQGEVAVSYDVGDGPIRAAMFGAVNALATELIGDGLLGYRVLSFWLGMLALALLYWMGRRLFSQPVGLIALGLMTVNLRAILLARSVTPEAALPAYVILAVALLAIAFHLRSEIAFRVPQTGSFAMLAALLGASGYLHYSLLALGPLAVLFLLHLVYTRQPLSRRIWNTGVFVLLLATVIGLPFLLSTLREPQLSEPYILRSAAPASVGDALEGLVRAAGAILWRGEADPARNVGDLPWVGPVTAILLLIGLTEALRHWRDPRYALLLLALAAGVLTDAWVQPAPTYAANLVATPAVMILPALGAVVVWRWLRVRRGGLAWRPVAVLLIGILFVNVALVRQRVFVSWPGRPEVQAAYHAPLGYLAAYLDRTPDDLPVSLCAVKLNTPGAVGLTPRQILPAMMHREGLAIRHSDCRAGLVLINAGEPMRFAFANLADRAQMPPELAEWLSDAVPIPVRGLADGSVLRLDVAQHIRDRGGYWDALAPAYYMPDENGDTARVRLPAALEQNLTFAGYDPRVFETARVAGGEPIVLISYWRVDGPLPPKLGIFAHLLAYPQTGDTPMPRVPQLEPWAEANTLDVIPGELKNRDFFVQASYIWLRDTLSPGDYALTLGAYDGMVAVLGQHLDVLDADHGNQPHGDRLLLGTITVVGPEDAADAETATH